MARIDYKKAYDIVPQSLIINYRKMYKISDDVINFIEKTMETWKLELIAGRKKLSCSEGQKRYSSRMLLLIIHMMPHNHIHWNFSAGYRFFVSQENINQLMYMDDIKLKKGKRTGNSNTCSDNIQSGHRVEFCQEKYAMLVMKSGKRHD